MRRLFAGLAGAAAVVVAVGAALAVAGAPIDPNQGDDFIGKQGGLRYSQEGRLAESGTSNIAGCGPAQWHLIGGGGAVSGPDAEAFLQGGQPYDYTDDSPDPDDGWIARGEGPSPTPVTATAICRKGGGVRYRVRSVQPGTSNAATHTVPCGGRRWHVTTGAGLLGTPGDWIHSSYPVDGGDRDRVPDDAWRVRLFKGPGVGFSVSAICIRNGDLSYRKSKPVTLGAGSGTDPTRTRARRVGCGKKREVVGGGGLLTGLLNRGRLITSGPVDAADAGAVPDDAWVVKAHNLGGTETKLTGYAICLR